MSEMWKDYEDAKRRHRGLERVEVSLVNAILVAPRVPVI